MLTEQGLMLRYPDLSKAIDQLLDIYWSKIELQRHDLPRSGRLEKTTIEIGKTHSRVTRLGVPLRFHDRLQLSARRHGSNRQRRPRRLKTNLHVGMMIQTKKRMSLVAVAPLQLVDHVLHLLKEAIEFGVSPFEQGAILRLGNNRKTID